MSVNVNETSPRSFLSGQEGAGCRFHESMDTPEPLIVRQPLARADLAAIAARQFGDMVKAVVDLDRSIMAIGAELHSDEEAALLEDGSNQQSLWGINLYPAEGGDDFVEFDSMINVRPSQGNRSREVESEPAREHIRRVVRQLVSDA
jgi:hypothetical protein